MEKQQKKKEKELKELKKQMEIEYASLILFYYRLFLALYTLLNIYYFPDKNRRIRKQKTKNAENERKPRRKRKDGKRKKS